MTVIHSLAVGDIARSWLYILRFMLTVDGPTFGKSTSFGSLYVRAQMEERKYTLSF